MVKMAVIVPCYNEEAVINNTIDVLSNLLLSMNDILDEQSSIVIVDDGSSDKTWTLAELLCNEKTNVHAIKLAHNVGHQNALLAGLMESYEKYDCCVSIDADLQDDINVIRTMVEMFKLGTDIVYGVRSDRTTDTFFKRNSAKMFYKFMKSMGVDIVENHADFRLMSRRAISALENFSERNMFLRGVVPTIGYKTDCVYYERKKRTAGESKYPLKKMLAFAFDGITSFSVSPIRIVSVLGIVSCFISIVAGLYALVQKIMGHTVAGWTSIVWSIWFIGGLQLMGIGLIGEYIGKIYKEVKNRPRYIIEKNI